MLGIGANLIKSAYRRGLAYVRDGLKLYMPYRGANHSEVKFVGSGSTYFTTNDYVDCGSDSSLDTGSSAFSVCAWFYATNGAESQTIVSKGASQSSASGDVGWALSITANEAVFFDMNEDSSTTRDATSTAHNAFNINQWHHVAIVRPAGATAGRKIYVDGVDVTSSTANAISDCDDGGQDFKIGVCQSGRYFDGNIKNVGYWSRVLTATEVQNVMYKTYDELSGRLTSNLVSWWALDVDYTDSTGTNNGTNSGSTLNADKYGDNTPVIPRAIDNAPTVQADGIGGGSMVFDSGDYVYLSDSSSYSDTDGFSMAFWVKFDSITGDTALVTKHADYADLDNSGEFYIINDDGICEFVILDHSESASIGTKTGTVFATNQWYHVACTHDGGTAATGCKIYIDGVLQTHSANNTGSGFANIEDTANQLRLGVFADGGEPFDGNMCQFGFWSVELTQAQVLSVMEKTYDEFNADDKTGLVSQLPLEVNHNANVGSGASNSGTSADTSVFPLKKGSPPDFGTLYSGRALEFDGVGDYIDCGHISPAGTAVSISLWFSTTANENAHLAGEFIASTNGIRLATRASGILWVQNGNGSSGQYAQLDTSAAGNNDYNDGNWHHLAGTYNGSTLTLYYDGVSGGTASSSLTLDVNSDFYIGRYLTQEYFDGKIANVQVWNAALTEAEVQYSYTHPEKFAYNTSGSSLTASNLVAWYPMIEGEGSTAQIPVRSPQMYITDGSEKGLGSEIVTGFTNGSTYPFNTFTTSGQDISSAIETSGNWGGCASNVLSVVAGEVYKCTFNLTYNSGTTTLRVVLASNAIGSGGLLSNALKTNTNGLNTVYFTVSTTDTTAYLQLGTWNASDVINFSATDISLKKVKMGNHGATVFYGEEEMSNGGFETDTGTPPNGWQNLDDHTGVGTADGTAPAGSNVVEVTAGSAGAAADSFRQVEADGLVAGRTYRCTFYAKTISGNTTLSAWVQNSGGDITTNQTITSSWTQYNYTFTANQTTRDQRWWLGGAGVFRMDEVSFKEVGIAEGWSAVDSEPLIPQTALMGLSKKRAFDGFNDHVVIADNNAFSFTDGSTDEHLSVSAWILPYTAASFPIITKGVTNTSGEWVFQLDASSKLLFQCMDQATSDCWIGKKYNTALTAGKLYHVVATYSGTEASSGIKLYINGEEVTVVTEANDEGSYNYMVNGSADVHIGRYNSGTTNTYAHGIIDEVAIWDTAVLSLAEIQAIFNDGVPLDVSSNSGDYTSSGDLVGYWRNNNFTTAGTWDDLSDTNVNGTIAGFVATDYALLPQGTTAGKDILGFPLTHVNNGWLNLDGAGYVNAGDNDLFTFINGGFSLECWFKMDAAPSDVEYLIAKTNVGSATNADDTEYGMFLDSNKKLFIRLFDDSASAYIGAYFNTALNLNQWYHVVCTHTAGGTTSATCKIYLGETATPTPTELKTDVDSETGTYVAMENATDNIPLVIGAKSNGASAFNGSIDEVRIYDRELSAAEITKNYNHGKSKHS